MYESRSSVFIYPKRVLTLCRWFNVQITLVRSLYRARQHPPHFANLTTLHLLHRPLQSIEMLDVEDFDAVFQGLKYTDGLVQQIQEYQHALGGQTFFERLLELLKIKGIRNSQVKI